MIGAVVVNLIILSSTTCIATFSHFAWEVLPVSLPVEGYDSCTGVWDDTLWSLSGYDSGGRTDAIRFMKVEDLYDASKDWDDRTPDSWAAFTCSMSYDIIDNLMYIVSPWPYPSSMFIFDMDSKNNVDMADYDSSPISSINRPCVVTDKEFIYAIGGWPGGTTRSSVLRIYDIAGDIWSYGASMSFGRDISSCNWDYVNNDIYVFGGLTSSGLTDSIAKYSIDDNSWIDITSRLNETRYYHMSVFINDLINGPLIYIIGGFTVTSTEIFSINLQMVLPRAVSEESDLPFDQSHCGSASKTIKTIGLGFTKDKIPYKTMQMDIYCVGGYDSSSSSKGSVDIKHGIILYNETRNATLFPTVDPSFNPTNRPSMNPTVYPTPSPTPGPTPSPSINPTGIPSARPTLSPTSDPSRNPSTIPSRIPTDGPTPNPTEYPSANPSRTPSNNPSRLPSLYPSVHPTNSPTKFPSSLPTDSPTDSPSRYPSKTPSFVPTEKPSIYPTTTITTTINPPEQSSLQPTNYPTTQPTEKQGSWDMWLIVKLPNYVNLNLQDVDDAEVCNMMYFVFSLILCLVWSLTDYV